MNLLLIGMNFRSAPLEIRERMSFKTADIPKMLRCLKRLMPDVEFVLLTTCNRSELYAAGPNLMDYRNSLHLIFARGGNLLGPDNFEHYLYQKTNLEAVNHLFSVSASLDSMVVGEREILGQVKSAYTLALEAGSTGSLLNPLFQKAFKVAKQVQTDTAICRGHVSVSSVAVDFVEKIFSDFSSKTVLILGAGETSELTLQSLAAKGVKNILVLNRSPEKGKRLAEQYNGKAISYDLLKDFLPQADIIISSTNAPHCVIHAPSIRQAIAQRRRRPMLLIDLAVPRDIDPEVGDIENVYLYNIDDLQDIAAENMNKRQECVQSAASIIQSQTHEFSAWFHTQHFGSLIRRMELTAAEIRDTELEKIFAREELSDLPESARKEIRNMLHRTVSRILTQPKIAIRQAARNGNSDQYIQFLRHLIGVDNGGTHES